MKLNKEPSEEEFSLDILYQKLRDLELLEEQVLKIRHKSFSDTPFFEDVRDKVIFFKNAIQNINQFRDILRNHINICSRPYLRQLHIFDLPDEILMHICEYVQGREEYYIRYLPEINVGVQEVKNMRLTCRRFCNVSSHLLISCVNLELDTTSLFYLKEISRHPTISLGVEVIRINLLYYDSVLEEDIDNFGDYHAQRLLETTEFIEDMANNDTEFFLNTPKDIVESSIQKARSIGNAWLDFVAEFSNEISNEDLGYRKLLLRAYRKYKRLYARQERLYANDTFPRTIAAAMSRMPNAKRIDIFNSDFTARPKRCRRPDFMTMMSSDESLINSTLYPITWEKGRRFQLGDPPFALLFQIPKAIKEAGIFLTALDIKVPPDDFYKLSSDEGNLQNIIHSTQGLKSFSFDPKVPYCSDLWAADHAHEVEAFGKFLSAHLSSPTLRDIQLSCDFLRADESRPWFSLGFVLTQNSWPKLESISLTGLAFHFSDIEKFISQFDHPIIIWFKRVHLMSGTWESVLDVLHGKVGAYPTLEDLSGAEFDNFSESEKALIMGKQDNSWDMNQAELHLLATFNIPNPFRRRDTEVIIDQ